MAKKTPPQKPSRPTATQPNRKGLTACQPLHAPIYKNDANEVSFVYTFGESLKTKDGVTHKCAGPTINFKGRFDQLQAMLPVVGLRGSHPDDLKLSESYSSYLRQRGEYITSLHQEKVYNHFCAEDARDTVAGYRVLHEDKLNPPVGPRLTPRVAVTKPPTKTSDLKLASARTQKRIARKAVRAARIEAQAARLAATVPLFKKRAELAHEITSLKADRLESRVQEKKTYAEALTQERTSKTVPLAKLQAAAPLRKAEERAASSAARQVKLAKKANADLEVHTGDWTLVDRSKRPVKTIRVEKSQPTKTENGGVVFARTARSTVIQDVVIPSDS